MGKFLSYLRYRWPLLLLWALATAIMLLTAYLGGQDMALFRYGAGVLAFLTFFFLLLDGSRFFRRLAHLRALRAQPGAIAHQLPGPENALEALYGDMLRELAQQNEALRLALEQDKAESLTYYTLWVHQIKTPIAAMRLVLQKEPGPASNVLQQELFKIERYADLALQYIKLQDMAGDLVISHCDLNALVRESAKKYALLFVDQGLSLKIDPLAGDVVSDGKWLRFILEQLLSNAAKYTRRGGLHIYMDGPRLVLEDTGIGIAPEDLPRIFERGYTGYNGRLDTRASGIGLFMAKRVADTLSISLSVKSSPGKGTAVTLSFPSGDTFRFM